MSNRMILLWMVTVLVVSNGCQPDNEPRSHALVITSDFNSVRRCHTLEEVHQVARTIISADPDILAMDAASPDMVNFRGGPGAFIPGSAFDALFEHGHDPYGIMVDTLRNHGICVMANIRMNDHHGREVYWTPWEREHKEWSLGTDTGARDWKSIGALRHMDYAQAGVREYRLAILEAILDRYPVDGIQLDFGRTAPFVSEPRQENGIHMTGYVRSVRRLLQDAARTRNRKAPLMLGALLPWDLEFCRNQGLDIKTWIDEGLVDYVSPGEWYYADWNIPLDAWRGLTEGSSCQLYPFTPGNVSPYQEFEYGEQSLLGDNRVLNPAKIRALADNFMAQNPDGFAFYNFYVFDFGEYYPQLRTWTTPSQSRGGSRHYFNARRLLYQSNERETFDLGVAFERYPLTARGDTVRIPFRFSSDLFRSRAILRCAIKGRIEAEDLAIRMNASALECDSLWVRAIEPDSGEAFDATIWQGTLAMPPLQPGMNHLEFEPLRSPPKPEGWRVGEFEVVVHPLD